MTHMIFNCRLLSVSIKPAIFLNFCEYEADRILLNLFGSKIKPRQIWEGMMSTKARWLIVTQVRLQLES